jgi:ParB family chromosome partitioning protein
MALDLSALDDEPVKKGADPAVVAIAAKAPPDAFEEDPGNPRFEFDDPEFDDFVEDVRARGILQPLIVVPLPSGKLRIRFGARRYRAARHLGLAEIPYTITEDERQLDDYAQVSENQRRKNLTPMELARFVQRRIDAGEKKKDIAAKLRLDPADITQLQALLELPTFLLELYHSNKCRSAKFLYDLRNLHKQNADVVEHRCKEADGISRSLIADLVEAIQKLPSQSDSRACRAGQAAPAASRDTLDGGQRAAAAPNGDDLKGGAPSTVLAAEQSRETAREHAPAVPGQAPTKQTTGHDPSDDITIKTPMLLGRYNSRDVVIVLTQRPSSSGRVVVWYQDGGARDEVAIGDVVLTALTDAAV